MDPSRITELCRKHGVDLSMIQKGTPNFCALPGWLRGSLLQWDRDDNTIVATPEHLGIEAPPPPPVEPPTLEAPAPIIESPTAPPAADLQAQLAEVQEQLEEKTAPETPVQE